MWGLEAATSTRFRVNRSSHVAIPTILSVTNIKRVLSCNAINLYYITSYLCNFKLLFSFSFHSTTVMQFVIGKLRYCRGNYLYMDTHGNVHVDIHSLITNHHFTVAKYIKLLNTSDGYRTNKTLFLENLKKYFLVVVTSQWIMKTLLYIPISKGNHACFNSIHLGRGLLRQ